MIEARRTEEPGGWSEGLTAPYNLIVCWFYSLCVLLDYVPNDILSHDDLRDVKANSGDVAAEENKHYTDDNRG